jgi:hypothetical protein
MGKSKRQSEVKIAHLKTKLQENRSVNRQLRQKVKELTNSRNHQKKKVKRLRVELERNSRKSTCVAWVPESKRIQGHKYDLGVVSLCVCLYAFAGCSLRCVNRVLVYLHLEYGIAFGELPSKSSIENWVQKVGLYQYVDVGSDLWAEYCIILDESMVIGQQRMLLALGARAKKEGEAALGLAEVKVLSFAVKASWKWEDVRDFLQKVQEKVGTKASYVVCDGGCNLKKGVHEVGLIRICDVGHEICKWTEQTYKEDERFKAWIKEVTKVRFQVFMKQTAYLMPPKQRTVARFTNLSYVVQWAANMLRVLPGLSKIEQQTFGWLKLHKTLIAEFAQVFNMNESILKILKNEGISAKNLDKSILICQKYSSKVPKCLIDKIVGYLKEEKTKLPDDKMLWNASSDVIESLFGKYKYKAASNTLNGVTPLVLSLCVYTHINDDQQQLQNKVKQALETISMVNLTAWKNENLVDNQLVRRRKMFKN